MSTDAIDIIRQEHMAVSAMLRSLGMLVERGPGASAERFFSTVRSMLFYMDEFPEKRHHPNESRHLFPVLLRCAPELRGVVEQLEQEHGTGEQRVRELQHLLNAWEVLGDTRRAAFVEALQGYIRFYLSHMRVEETELLPAAQRHLQGAERQALDATFHAARDPLAGGTAGAEYDTLFSRIVQRVPAPLGLGPQD